MNGPAEALSDRDEESLREDVVVLHSPAPVATDVTRSW